jgi:PTH1 family peptidyl-tRNA hydrolase
MKLVVGLGNPGAQYQATRHNVGFEVVEILAQRLSGAAKKAFGGELVDVRLGSEKVLLLQPHTYMNLSGQSVQQAISFYKLELADILVVCDDLNLPLGRLRFRSRGSAGGQKGLADCIRRLGTDEFPRLRIGIDRPQDSSQTVNFVLSTFKKDERAVIDDALQRASEAVEVWALQGAEACMSQFNG